MIGDYRLLGRIYINRFWNRTSLFVDNFRLTSYRTSTFSKIYICHTDLIKCWGRTDWLHFGKSGASSQTLLLTKSCFKYTWRSLTLLQFTSTFHKGFMAIFVTLFANWSLCFHKKLNKLSLNRLTNKNGAV